MVQVFIKLDGCLVYADSISEVLSSIDFSSFLWFYLYFNSKKFTMASLEAVPGTPDGSVNSSTFRKEGPVLCFINKRLRSLKKKHNRILQIEENKSKGKTINKEQEDVLRSKVGVLTLIDELEKLKQPLSIAVKEEIAERERELTVKKVLMACICNGLFSSHEKSPDFYM